jgi:hypothetical protein
MDEGAPQPWTDETLHAYTALRPSIKRLLIIPSDDYAHTSFALPLGFAGWTTIFCLKHPTFAMGPATISRHDQQKRLAPPLHNSDLPG